MIRARAELPSILVTLVLTISSTPLLPAQGGGSFEIRAPLKIPVAHPVSVTAADFNGDGKLDLATLNGTDSIDVFLQNPRDRLEWQRSPWAGGLRGYFIRSADLDSDGNADLVIADPGSTAYFLLGRGDGTFNAAVGLGQASGSREITIGDWNGDGLLDLASADHDAGSVSVFLGKGSGRFQHLTGYITQGQPHAVKTIDYDGDAKLDLMVGVPQGYLPLQGTGDGFFRVRGLIGNLGCNGRYLATGDFNGDGKGDLVAFCDSYIVVGLSLGDGTYRKVLEVNGQGLTFLSNAIADLNGDGFVDLAFTGTRFGLESRDLFVYLGAADGRFSPEIVFPGVGFGNSYLIASDLDQDGHPDLVSADSDSSSLTVTWGQSGEQFLDVGSVLTGFSAATSLEVGDLDRDGRPDFFLSIATSPEVKVYLNPGLSGKTLPSLAIPTSNSFSSLQVSDLDGDGGPDLAGINRAGGKVLAALLDPGGRAREQVERPAGLFPSSILVGRLDAGSTPDLAAPSSGSGSIAVIPGTGGGSFAEAFPVPTIEKPKWLAAADLDGDGRMDLALLSAGAVAVHHGQAGAMPFGAAAPIHQGDHSFSDLASADLDADGRPDLLASDLKSSSILVFSAGGGGTLEKRDPLSTDSLPNGLEIADVDGDGLPDVTAASSFGRSVTVFLNRGKLAFAPPVEFVFGFSLLGHRLADLDLDGALDLIAFKGNIAVMLAGSLGTPSMSGFVRGDADGDGRIEISDPILILGRLFLGAPPVSCEDAADANDDGELNLTDPIAILDRLFLGGAPFPPPGPEACGADPTADPLPQCGGRC
jgi:hypothetical protein